MPAKPYAVIRRVGAPVVIRDSRSNTIDVAIVVPTSAGDAHEVRLSLGARIDGGYLIELNRQDAGGALQHLKTLVVRP